MSFSITLMENLSPSNYVTKNVSAIATATGTLRESSSIIDPVFEIESTLEADILGRVNYARIDLWNRYYFVRGITLDYNRLWIIGMHVDVLMTYSVQIRQQNAIVARQERQYNMYLDDGWFMAYQNPIVHTPKFSVDAPFENQSYILVLAGS